MLYTPLLPGAAAGTLEPRHVVVPLREHLSRTDLLLGHVTGADPDRKRVFVTTAEGQERELGYDQLIIALGSISRTLPIPGLREHAVGFKTLSDAIALRNQIVNTLERAEAVEDEAARRALLTYVFVGAGYAGLEGLAELQDFAADVVDLYPRSRVQGLRFILVEARPRVMYEISEDLAAFAVSELRHRGIEVRTSTTVERISADSVELSDGEVVPCRTVAWTAGVRPAPVVEKLGLPLDDAGRIVADRFCQVQGACRRVGDRRRRRGARPRPSRPADAADLPARAAPGPHGGRQRRGGARRRPPAPVHVQDARRVRGHGPPEGRGRDGRHQVARLPRLVPGPHVPPGDDAGPASASSA